MTSILCLFTCINNNNTCPAVSIGFVSEEYKVAENVTEVEVYLHMNVSLGVALNITLSVTQDTAKCEWETIKQLLVYTYYPGSFV